MYGPLAAVGTSARIAAQLRAEHCPAKQLRCPPTSGHTVPQPPQFSGSLAVVDSHPSLASPLQFARPALQLATAHCPPTHAAVAPARVQRVAQAPQWSALTRVSVS